MVSVPRASFGYHRRRKAETACSSLPKCNRQSRAPFAASVSGPIDDSTCLTSITSSFYSRCGLWTRRLDLYPIRRCGVGFRRTAGLTTSPDIGVADSLALPIELFRSFERTIHDRRRRAFQSQERDRVASGCGPTLQPVFEYETFDA